LKAVSFTLFATIVVAPLQIPLQEHISNQLEAHSHTCMWTWQLMKYLALAGLSVCPACAISLMMSAAPAYCLSAVNTNITLPMTNWQLEVRMRWVKVQPAVPTTIHELFKQQPIKTKLYSVGVLCSPRWALIWAWLFDRDPALKLLHQHIGQHQVPPWSSASARSSGIFAKMSIANHAAISQQLHSNCTAISQQLHSNFTAIADHAMLLSPC
jgi:hypothetical protein